MNRWMDGRRDVQKKWHIEVGAPPKYIKLATFQQWAKGSREAASEGPTVLLIHFCSLCNAAVSWKFGHCYFLHDFLGAPA